MAPSATETGTSENLIPIYPIKTQHGKAPLKTTGLLQQFESFDVTPVIGREYPKLKVVDLLKAPNADDLIKELAIIISERGVVFFRAQNDLTNDLQKEFIQRLGEQSGKPTTSKLHIHPILNPERQVYGGNDKEISTISSENNKKLYRDPKQHADAWKKQGSGEWHSDIAFEQVPADYSSLRVTQLPSTGGDTLWASGHELYDRISAPYQKFLETLDATYTQEQKFKDVATRNNFKLYTEERGAPENVGDDLTSIHPVVRTNPVTGWKSIFPVGGHVCYINGLAEDESKHLLDWFVKLVVENHDLQVRFKWNNENDLAIWDNRSTLHTATYDYDGLGPRFGSRAVGLGERPYLDLNSKSRRETLEAAGQSTVVA